MDFAEIAKQGLGYLLFVLSCGVIGILYRDNKKLSEEKVTLANQRVEDLKEVQEKYGTVLDTSTKIADNTFIIVQNLQTLLNNLKKS